MSMNNDLVLALGVDGGGTKTQAAVVDEHGRVRGEGLAGPSSFDKTNLKLAAANIRDAIDGACAAAGINRKQLNAAFFGMAGVTSEQDRAHVRGIAVKLGLPAERVGVDHDLRAALAGGLSGRPGIVLIAGTGSSCYGVNAAGVSWKSGGHGTMVSDEGSSYWIGLRAIRAAVMIQDGRLPGSSPALLVEPVMRQLGISSVDDIMHRLHVQGIAPVEVAAFAPLLITAAQHGDAYAQSVLREGMQLLADCVAAVARKLGMADEACELALVGGVFKNGDLVIEPLRQAVRAAVPGCSVKLAEMPPVHGACIVALQNLGIAVDEAVIRQMRG